MRHIYMKNESRKKTIWLKAIKYIILFNLIFISSAYAYVDPGSGSVIVTTVLGLIAAIGYTVRKYYYKVKRIFVKKSCEEEEQRTDNND